MTRMLRSLNPALAIILIPLIKIIPNTVMIAPPRTAFGIAEKIAPSFGKNPEIIKINAPVAIHHLFTTFVMATIPAFCPNAVFGSALNTAAVVEPSASARIAPEVSFSVASLSKPAMVIPEVLPIVSRPEVTNSAAKLKIAERWNSSLNCIGSGIPNHAASAITIPRK